MLPLHRHGKVDTEMFKRYQRSEQALLLSLMEMAVNSRLEGGAPRVAFPENLEPPELMAG